LLDLVFKVLFRESQTKVSFQPVACQLTGQPSSELPNAVCNRLRNRYE
jgi:hypothetical protein